MKPFLIFLIGILAVSFSKAQTLLNTTGITLQNSNIIIEYSIGEVSITTLSISGKDITQGLLQPNLKINNPDCDIIAGELKWFENATADKLRIVGINDWIKAYQIFAADGKLVRFENFYNNHINVAGLPAAGIYFIRLLPGCNGKFKVIKFMKR